MFSHIISNFWYTPLPFVCLILCFVPFLVAQVRGHSHKWMILTLTLFLGWTLLVWIAMMFWAIVGEVNQQNTKK